MRKPEFCRISLKDLRRDAWDVEDAGDLDPAEYATRLNPIIIERANGVVGIVDGFHRASGLLGWAEAAQQDPAVIMVEVVDTTGYDEDTIAEAGDGFGGERHEAAIRKILRAAKRGR